MRSILLALTIISLVTSVAAQTRMKKHWSGQGYTIQTPGQSDTRIKPHWSGDGYSIQTPGYTDGRIKKHWSGDGYTIDHGRNLNDW